MGEASVKDFGNFALRYRKLVGGGAVAFVRNGRDWVWRYRSSSNVQNEWKGTIQDWPKSAFSTVEEFAKSIDIKIDYQDYVLNTLPIPRRREAVMATREKL